MSKWLDDGFGTRWIKCDRADCGLEIERPGLARCVHGEPCPDADAWMRKNFPEHFAAPDPAAPQQKEKQ